MAMTTKPVPCDAPVSLCEGALKFLMSCWKGAYMTVMRIWPPMPNRMPRRSSHLKRIPRSRAKCFVPCVRLASQGAPMKPIHRPISVDTTYHSGGTVCVAIACIWADVLPATAPAMKAKIVAAS